MVKLAHSLTGLMANITVTDAMAKLDNARLSLEYFIFVNVFWICLPRLFMLASKSARTLDENGKVSTSGELQ